ncbi:cupin domain-containing protein [Streptomyces physcomitrii]|uniref:Cupin domain-containing protein n=1 Tax=Streptomyces physcomitrii TaxID=2724184 RepID=A0ABX1H3K7_9ACTN|nr:cupin domain-containing protein [Streptomyces physcomitrii]NKI42622.1 cupin domain-containing protein [Streptomyces physcomitrii]
MTKIILPEDRPAGRRGFEIVLPSSLTDGAASLVEAHVSEAMSGPPLHTHAESDETYFVLGGALIMIIDGKLTELRAGGLAHISKDTSHTWATRPDEGAHFLTLHLPGGYELYHPTALHAEHEKGGPLEQKDLFELAARFDWRLAGPPEPHRLTPTGVLVPAGKADAEAEATKALATAEYERALAASIEAANSAS